jgi:hypothetical protein
MAGRIESERAAIKRTKKGDAKRWHPVISRPDQHCPANSTLLSLYSPLRRDQSRVSLGSIDVQIDAFTVATSGGRVWIR